MAIASPPPPSISASLRRLSENRRIARFSSYALFSCGKPPDPRRFTLSSRLYSSKSSDPNGSMSPYEYFHYGPQIVSTSQKGVPVFVMLPMDSVNSTGRMVRPKTMSAAFLALSASGVQGITVEVWWGVVERDAPGVYDWTGYLEIMELARRHGLKVRAILAFHQSGSKPVDSCWFPLPKWVLDVMKSEPDISYADRFGRRSEEYISLACDTLPVLKGRSPIQAYSDFMRSFRDNFREFLGVVITGIQIGMGPAGELRYPSCPSEKLAWAWRTRELGEFQCYDKFMLSTLNACARDIGMREWGSGGPFGAGSLMQNPEETNFFKNDGSWSTSYGQFFLEWYSEMLLLHGERLCMAADSIFWGTGAKISAKIAAIHWHYNTRSHPSELTSGYYNTFTRDGYLAMIRMFGRYRITLCCSCFDMKDSDERQINPTSSPEGFLRQLIFAARMYGIPLIGENSVMRLDDSSLKQVINSSKLYLDGDYESSFSFNFVRMNKNLFDSHNWTRFTRFVRQMSDSRTFQARLDFGGSELCSSCTADEVGVSFGYH